MAMIDAARFTALKARVQAECLRRKYNGSVVDYGGVDYYFKNQPAPDTIAAEEHFEKIAVPLNAINSDKIPYTDGDRIISDEEMTALLREHCDLTPGGIIKKLDLRRPIYGKTAMCGHFGVEDLPWEQTDLAQTLKELACI